MSATHSSVLINLIGTGCTVACGKIKTEYWKIIERELEKNKTTFSEFISDETSLRYLELDGLKTWKDIGNEFLIKGLVDSSKSTIELKIGDKKKTNISFREIQQEEILFPLYTSIRLSIDITQMQPSYDEKRLVVVESEIGKIGAIKFNTAEFSIDKLAFQITDLKVSRTISYSILSKITYDKKPLKPLNSDTLLSGFYSLY
ncbi:MAG: hypothetical protein POELPBGB_03624 [Bacteroidia bacterium]|nr:hypothetical protein [Bacteroidia bacterium]